MNRAQFLTIAACVAGAVGCLALGAPDTLLAEVKQATPNPSGRVMARTVGVLLIAVGALAFLVRNDEDSPTLKKVLLANLLLQVMILPIDPIAWYTGAFHSLGSFVPNTLIHIVLAAGFGYHAARIPSP